MMEKDDGARSWRRMLEKDETGLLNPIMEQDDREGDGAGSWSRMIEKPDGA